MGALRPGNPVTQVILRLPGSAPATAAVITAEIGEVTRFRNAGQLCSWAGLPLSWEDRACRGLFGARRAFCAACRRILRRRLSSLMSRAGEGAGLGARSRGGAVRGRARAAAQSRGRGRLGGLPPAGPPP